MGAVDGGTGGIPPILELCKEFAALEIGTVVRFDEGVDFTVKPGTFRNSLHRQMRNEGYEVQSIVRDGSVYAKVKYAAAAPKTAPEPATRSEPSGPATMAYAVLGQTNPSVPAAVFQVPTG